MGDSVTIPWVIAIIIIVLLVLIFSTQIDYWVQATKTTLVSILTGQKPKECAPLPDDDDMKGRSENLSSAPAATTGSSDMLQALGYEQPWTEVIKQSELDPATFSGHKEFVKDVRRFSSGANFTSVTDDNTNAAFTNFRGLLRPQHVHIGEDARQQPDIDTDVLKRNKNFRW